MRHYRPIPDDLSRIALVGFMGAGKSTVGPLLAEHLGWRFIDTDRRLEQISGTTVADLFATRGEAEFRRMEAEAIAELHRERELVLALGGGALENEATRSLLSASSGTCMIFLQAPLEVSIDRCERQPSAAVRPVLNQREALRERFQSRKMHYETAHIAVDTDGVTPPEVVDLILESLQGKLPAIPISVKAASF